MMVSSKGRYALRVLIDLAQHSDEGYISLKDIADRQEASLKYLENIIAILNRAGLVRSLRGKTGGYVLARPAANITACEVLTLTEGSLAPVSCMGLGEHMCSKADVCPTLPLWQQLDKLVDGFLSGISIEDLALGRVGEIKK
jgi:Rrf2 family protein